MTIPALTDRDRWRFQAAQTGAIELLFLELARNLPSVIQTASGFVYDGSDRLEQFTADGVLYSIGYPDAFTINIAYSGILRQVTLDANGRVIGITTT